ncbi:hypothetical protein [Roseofilum casamattae]|uniref:Uncharacterized protein n=1 Tax=Roseofilum casamattae BLCC-M143 TaxID=3022442 RepID=A0ABT7BYR2_9CYAN|nr:hypothetical protein [Roseofilum casamattae]MDJ1184349.1 hypothetical protein [Roseofilum casamattae BLCC-M143]
MLHSYHSDLTSLSLTQELHQRVFDSIHNDCTPSLQAHLECCHFGIAPDYKGVNTLCIIAPDRTLAQELLRDRAILLETIANRAVGIMQTAICFVPFKHYDPKLWEDRNSYLFKFLVGHVFSNPS